MNYPDFKLLRMSNYCKIGRRRWNKESYAKLEFYKNKYGNSTLQMTIKTYDISLDVNVFKRGKKKDLIKKSVQEKLYNDCIKAMNVLRGEES